MRVLITGATGLVGRPLCLALIDSGHAVVALSRNPDASRRRSTWLREVHRWRPEEESPPARAFEGVDAVVHLAGESVVGLWTAGKRDSIRRSRALGTSNLVDAMLARGDGPQALVAASAVGYYGDRGEEILTDDAGPGQGFLAEVCVAWEAEASRAEGAGVRVARLRSGNVLAARGGALGVLRRIFAFGLGGPIGGGRQWWPWVHIDDAVGIIRFALENEVSGAFNATAPGAVRQGEFARALGKTLHRPALP